MAELCRQLPLRDAAVTISACMGCSSRPQTGLGIAPDPTAWRGKVFGGSVPSSDTRCKTVLWGGREGVASHWEQNHPESPAKALPRPGLSHLGN